MKVEDLKAYIDSGILELYVLGSLSQGERDEVHSMLQKHPELRYELREIEKALEKYAVSNAIEPEEHLRDKVLQTLNFSEETIVKDLPSSSNKVAGDNNFYKYAFAASLALLLLSIIAIVNLNRRLEESDRRIATLESANQKFSTRANYLRKDLDDARQSLKIYQNPGDYRLVELKGLPKSPEAKMRVAFNEKEALVLIDLASLQMPATDEAHQYQLWAMVDGKPVDLGVFDPKPDSTGMIKMKPVRNAQAFAVTLEPHGGSENPSLDQMMVMGSL